jgi:hypothetical protein
MRKQERDIQQKKTDRQRMKATLRHVRFPQESCDEDSEDQKQKRRRITKTSHVATMNEKAENEKFSCELDTTEKGLLRFMGDCWKKMEEKEKDFVRDYNASIKHGNPIDKLTMPEGIILNLDLGVHSSKKNQIKSQSLSTTTKTTTRQKE